MTDLPRKPKQEKSERTEAPPRTPAELRAYADRREAEATEAAQAAYDLVFEKCMVEVQRIRQAADVVERLGEMTATRDANLAAGGGGVVPLSPPATGPESSRLPSGYEIRTMIGTEMEAQKLTGEERRRLGIAKAQGSKHPFPRALYKDGKTVTEWAAKRNLDRNIVKSWFAKGPACRPIPRKYATEIEKTYGIPATEETWRAGIK